MACIHSNVLDNCTRPFTLTTDDDPALLAQASEQHTALRLLPPTSAVGAPAHQLVTVALRLRSEMAHFATNLQVRAGGGHESLMCRPPLVTLATFPRAMPNAYLQHSSTHVCTHKARKCTPSPPARM